MGRANSETQRQLRADAFECREDPADAVHAPKTAALLAREDLDVRALREFVGERAVHVIGRKPDAREVLEALRQDPLRRDLERRVVLAFEPRMRLAHAHVLIFFPADAMHAGEFERERAAE